VTVPAASDLSLLRAVSVSAATPSRRLPSPSAVTEILDSGHALGVRRVRLSASFASSRDTGRHLAGKPGRAELGSSTSFTVHVTNPP